MHTGGGGHWAGGGQASRSGRRGAPACECVCRRPCRSCGGTGGKHLSACSGKRRSGGWRCCAGPSAIGLRKMGRIPCAICRSGLPSALGSTADTCSVTGLAPQDLGRAIRGVARRGPDRESREVTCTAGSGLASVAGALRGWPGMSRLAVGGTGRGTASRCRPSSRRMAGQRVTRTRSDAAAHVRGSQRQARGPEHRARMLTVECRAGRGVASLGLVCSSRASGRLAAPDGGGRAHDRRGPGSDGLAWPRRGTRRRAAEPVCDGAQDLQRVVRAMSHDAGIIASAHQ